MSSVSVVPEVVSQAAGQLGTIGSALNAAHATAAGPTTEVLAPAADEVSAAITALMNSSAQEYQALARQVAKFHDLFTNNLLAGGNSYAATEAANVAPLEEALRAEEEALQGAVLDGESLSNRNLIREGLNTAFTNFITAESNRLSAIKKLESV
jgi:hypothetical protein